MQANRISVVLRRCLLAAALCAGVSAHAQTAALPPGVAARVNGVAITDDQVAQAAKASGAQDTPQLRQIVKTQLITRQLILQAAAKHKAYDKNPEVKQAMQEAHDLAISRLYLHDQLKPAPVTEADIKAQFDAIVASLGDKEYKASIIEVADEATARKVLDKLKQNGADFAQLARQYSQAPNKSLGGELQWASFKLPAQEGHTQNLPLPIAQAISTLPAGGVTAAPVAVGSAWFIVKLDEVRPTQVPKYDDVKAALRQTQEGRALQTATTALIARLVHEAKVEQ